jgi:hypothetical protein
MGNDPSSGNNPAGAGDESTEIMVGAAGAALVHIDFFPEEVLDGDVARGRFYVYVRGQPVKEYDACGGPPADQAHADRGGHYAAPTTAGNYILGGAQHYTTDSWPTSTIPWGAQIRVRDDQEIEYSTDGATWLPATGTEGCVTRSWMAFEQRTRAATAAQQNAAGASDPNYVNVDPAPLTADDIKSINEQSRSFFYAGGVLTPTYVKNDFGVWAWNLQSQGAHGLSRTGMFVHTTPHDEASTAAGQPFQLTDSHGCIHIRPVDRDEMMNLGYLQKGVHFNVKKYGVKGP